MSYRLVKLGGLELLVNIDDSFRSSAVWQYGLKPAAYAGVRGVAWARGVTGRLFASRPPLPPANDIQQSQPAMSDGQRATWESISGVKWFHSIDLPDGLTTPGDYDHRPLLHHYPLPERLDGLRVLDAGTLDGFWAFEMEKRGAREIVALDVASVSELDLPPHARSRMDPAILAQRTGAGFELAHRLRKSKVQRVTMNLFDLSPDRLGKFDLVFCSDLLCLVSRPVQVLQNLRAVTAGEAIIVDRFNTYLPQFHLLYHGADEGCLWWTYSLSALEKMIKDAGFSSVEIASTFKFAAKGARAWSAAAVFRAKASEA